MNNRLIAVFVCFGILGLTINIGAEVNFDQGTDMKSVMEEINNSSTDIPVVKYPGEPYYGEPYYDGSYYHRPYHGGHRYYTRDCARWTFGPSDNELMSERVRLHSQEYVEECYYTPSGPNGQLVEHCYDRPGASWRQSAQIQIKPRKLLAWEQETFEVCLEGPWMDLYQREVAYKYAVEEKGHYDVLFVLNPLYKIQTDPDINGLQFVEWTYDETAKTFKLKVNDIWHNDYAGEKVLIKAELRRDIPFWFDSSLGTREFLLDVAPNYELVIDPKQLADKEADFNDIKAAKVKKYYVKWGFKRIGKLSKDTFMKKGETPRIELTEDLK